MQKMVEFKAEDFEFAEDSGESSENGEENSDSEEPPIISNKKRPLKDDDPLSKATKKPKNELYKQPSAEELNKLRETENLFNSNIFRLQINELLEEIKIKPKYETQFDTWFKEFQKQVFQIPEFEELHLKALKLSKKKKAGDLQKFINYAAKVDRVECDQDVSMKFLKPKSTTFLHSSLKNIPNEKVKFVGNIIIAMNKAMFFEKDYLNNKYALKKHFYMLYIEHYIKNFENIKEIQMKNYLHNNQLKYLEIVPTFNDLVQINIFITPENDTFKANRFLPNKNNIKQLNLNAFPDFDVAKFSNQGSFLYNSALLFDYTLETNHFDLVSNLSTLNNIKDAIKLIIIWLRQRQLTCDYRGFTDDLAVYLVQYLFAKKKINKLMSSYQVVRIFWSFLVNLKDDKLSIALDVKPNDLQSFEGDFVLLDKSGCYNVAAFLDCNIFLKVKSEAKTALESLDSNRFNAFSHLFTTKMPVGLQYDAILKITDINNFKKIYWNCSDEDKFKYFGCYKLLVQKHIEKMLKFGLTNRITELIPLHSDSMNMIIFGINLNSEFCFNVIEKGPKQYEEGAEEFKEFWGTLAELRRFKDSSIYEAVYFEDVKTIQGKRLIFRKIVKFVMEEKLELNYEINGGELEKLLRLDHIENPFPTGSNEEATLKIKSAQMQLDKILRNLKLPLPITAVQCTSDLYSYTDLFPPIPTNCIWKNFNCKENGDFVLINEQEQEHYTKLPHLVDPIECVLQLAMNSKWPKTIKALRAMKAIYYYEISKLIRTEHDIVTSVRDDFVDIFYHGYVFRLRLHHPKEIALLKKDVTEDGLTFYKDTEESLELERDREILPKISGALNGLHQKHPCFGPSTCLIKRWLRSQLIDAGHISDVVISLLNASLFISSEPYKSAILPQVAFLRFLKFLAGFDCNFQTVTVNFNDGMSVEDLNDIDSKFLQNRTSYNALHVVTPLDGGKSVFTKHNPSNVIMKRIKCLAVETYKGLLTGLEEGNMFVDIYKSYFVPNLNGYDFLIHLNASANLRKYQQVNREQSLVIKLEAFDKELSKSLPVVGFDPIEFYLKELRKNYGDYALFFHDYYGGNVIAVLLKQNMLQEQEFKISNTHGCKLTPKGKLQLDIEALIEDFYIHGKGIVRTIEAQQK